MAGWPSAADLVTDALIGYGLRGDPAGTAAELITRANDLAAPVLASDTPSGLDLTTGAAGPPAIWAAATLTLALPKAGLLDAPGVGNSTWATSRCRWPTSGWVLPSRSCSASPACSGSICGRHPTRPSGDGQPAIQMREG